MAVDGFQRKITAILSADDDGCSRFIYDPEEPASHELTSYSAAESDIGKTGSTGIIGQLVVMKSDT